VTGFRCSPGAAGTVVNNLAALGVGQIIAVGFTGADGQGYELRRALQGIGVDQRFLLERADLMTPTYTKPLLHHADGRVEELSRLDIKNRRPLPEEVEDFVIETLRALLWEVDGMVIADQVQERNHGVITDRVREELAKLGNSCSGVAFLADSRTRIGEFRNILVKPNQHEAAAAVDGEGTPEDDARRLSERTGRPVYVTLGERGMLLYGGGELCRVPTVHCAGPIDIVGAGDSVIAGIMAALCSGAQLEEAALIGNLVASITIQQIGTTGTATREQVMERFEEAGRCGSGL
jgi:rfaE bifunctional protein kinase chain/domain